MAELNIPPRSRKIFSTIAKKQITSEGFVNSDLEEIYSNSTVNSDKSVLIALRSLEQTPESFLFGLRRVSEAFELYITSFTGTTLLQENPFRTDGVLSKNRSSTLYREFRSASYINIVKNKVSNNTLLEIFPDDKNIPDLSLMLENSRSSPVVSGNRDVTRFKNYLLSLRGISFLAKQQRLQSLNVFGQSRKYNVFSVPTSILNYSNSNLNSSFERVSRIVPNSTTTNPLLWGRLQKDTVISSQSGLKLRYIGGAQRSEADPLSQFVGSALNNIFKRQADKTNRAISGVIRRGVSWINSRVGTRLSIGETTTVGQIGRKIRTVVDTAEAIQRANSTSEFSTLEKDQTAYDALYADGLWPLLKQNDGSIRSFSGEKAAYIERARSTIQKLKGSTPALNNVNTFTRTSGEENFDDYRSADTYTDAVRSATGVSIRNGVFTARYIEDGFNLINRSGEKTAIRRSYELEDSKLQEEKDFIQLRFKVPGLYDTGISFRAFIENITHRNTAQFSDVTYVGRPERFITYSGASRSMTFTLYLIAFSEPEIHTIWTRANMLNKLTFPIKNDGGFMTPPITEITLGNVLSNQPGYVTNISTTFEKFPWDIDNELPMGIKLDMEFGIIEKNYVYQTEQGSNNPLLFNELASSQEEDNQSEFDYELFKNVTDPRSLRRRFSTKINNAPPEEVRRALRNLEPFFG